MKCGLELHMQLNTGKLFCNCPNKIIQGEEPDHVVTRKLRPVTGETGEVDIAVEKEAEKDRFINYECYDESVCLVDIDEEPPAPVNEKAFKHALEIGLLLNMRPVDEFHVMRKLIIDGSMVSGFQRTGLLARNGYVESSMGKVRINTLTLEEDSGKRIDASTFSLDRLGIPLVEITTKPDIKTGVHAKEVAEKIGMLCKFTGNLMRGIGTIRQDVNVSADNGARVEIKGVQDLQMLPKFVNLEVKRQERLLELKTELNEASVEVDEAVELSEVFEDSECSFLEGETVHGMRVMNAEGLLGFEIQKGKSFGKEIADVLSVYAGVQGLVHKDELPSYGISTEEVNKVINNLGCEEGDNFIIVQASEEEAVECYNIIRNRVEQASEGVPKEVRAPNHADGTTTFLRPVSESARMYPETDVPVKRLKHELISEIIENLSETPEQKFEALMNMGLNEELTNQLLHSDKLGVFEKVTSATNYDNKTTASLILENPVMEVNAKKLIKIFERLEEEELCKEAFPEVINALIQGRKLPRLLQEYETLSSKELMKVITETIEENDEILSHPSAFGTLMKKILDKVNKRADAGVISKVLREELKKRV